MGLALAHQDVEFWKDKNIGKIYYSKIPRSKQKAEAVAEKHSTKVELIEKRLVIDISLGDLEGKTYIGFFGAEDGGDFQKTPEKLMISNRESFYSVLDRLKKFLEKFWQSNEEVCTIIIHGAVLNLFGLLIMHAPLA